MKIKIKTLDNKELELEIESNLSVLDLKKLIEKRSNIPSDRQRIIYQGRVLLDDKKVSDYDVMNETVLHLVAMPQSQQPQQPQNQPQQNQQQNTQQMPRGIPNFPSFMSMSLGGEGGQSLDINSLLSNVLSGFGIRPQQNTQQTQQQTQQTQQNTQQQQTRSIRESRPVTIEYILELMTLLQNSLNNLDLSKIKKYLEKEKNMNTQERREAQDYVFRVLPEIIRLNQYFSEFEAILNNMNFGQNSGDFKSSSNVNRSDVMIHLHCNMNEVDQLPQKLEKIKEMTKGRNEVVTEIKREERSGERNVFSVMESISNELGIDNSDQSFLDEVISLITKDLNMTDLFQLMNGNWNCLEKSKKSLISFFKGKDKLIESWIDKVEELLKKKESFEILKNDIKIIEEIKDVLRFHFFYLFDIMKNENLNEKMKKELNISNLSQFPFSDSLQSWIVLLIGDLYNLLLSNKLSKDDIKKLITSLSENYIQSSNVQQMRSIPSSLFTGMFYPFIEKSLINYSNIWKNRVIQKKKLEKDFVQELVDETLDDLLNETLSEIKEKKEEKIVEKKEEIKKEKKEEWMNGLTDDEIKMILNTIKNSDDINDDEDFSQAYLQGSEFQNEKIEKVEKNEKVEKREMKDELLD